ncbi:penicillin-binding protein [Evansella vedderi]|uniref:Penicillin-binding protein n=1 Tax=Evansella vedderi TaxID=38282 RepID=A0ABT9ZUU0_9BACI|nr:transglycosylase domain-containing protein [Evansella vedderi]MDQ0255007.1 penicillin-binding protein [Evansella vedderi]
MSNHRFSFNKIFERKETLFIFKGIRITSQVVWNLFLIFATLTLMFIFFVGGAGAGYFASLVVDEPVRSYEDMKRDIYDYEEATEIYFANEIYLGDLPSPLERREVSLDEISQYVIDAVIATEDEYFFEHQGIVPKALLRAVYQDFSNAAMQTGGSTLTQQLIKNQILTSEVTHDRKAVEILLALRLEHFFDKEEILEAYLNVVPFGRNSSGTQIAGVQAAAQGIFGVNAKDLNLPQAAFIAGLPQSPFAYTPFIRRDGEVVVKDNLDPGLNRMQTVLNRMLSAGMITEEEHRDASAYDITEDFIGPQSSSIEDYPFITDEVRRRAREIIAKVLMEEAGVDLDEIEDENQRRLLETRYREEAARALQRNGYRIYTTVDKEIYDAHVRVVQEFQHFGPNKTRRVTDEQGEEVDKIYIEEAGSVLIENSTGRILSFVPGRDYDIQQYNHATVADRHIGSTMKPLLTYAIGFETGIIQPGTITPDIPHSYSDGTPVNNFDRRHLGFMTAREALQRSRNIPAVREAAKIPHDVRRSTLGNFGLESFFPDDSSFPHEATALGTLNLTVEATTNAYSVFANEGHYIESYMIERIETSNGEVIFEHESETNEVLSPQTNYLMIDMMRDVIYRSPGTATGIPSLLNFSADWAGKTGTSNDFVDSWFVAFNPNVSLGVWIGYDDTRLRVEQNYQGLTYGQRTQRLWAALANAAYEVNPDLMAPSHRFESPGGIVRQSICGISGKLPSDLCREAGLVTTDLFNSRFVPTEIDDSLERVNYVRVDGDYFKALDSTPSEFTKAGISVKEEYFDFGEDVDIMEFLPNNWDALIPDIDAPDNGKTPDQLTSLTASNNSISWNEHHEKDIIGYRVYYSPEQGVDFTLVDSVRWDEYYSYSGNEGAYYVTAVDVAGRESAPSEQVIIGEYIDPVAEEEERQRQEEEERRRQEEEERRNQEDEDDDEDDGNGDNNGNGNGNNGNRNGNGNGNGNENGNGDENDDTTNAFRWIWAAVIKAFPVRF